MSHVMVEGAAQQPGWAGTAFRARRLIRRNSMLIAGAFLVVGWVTLALLLPLTLPLDPIRQDGRAILVAPGQSPGYPLGTDHLGRDVLARLLFGARISLLIGWTSVIIAGAVGLILGILAAYYGGRLDAVVMRIAEAKAAFPYILLVLLLLSVVIPGPGTIIGVFVFVGWPIYAKVVRGTTLSLLQEEYVAAARAVGGSDLWIMRYHLLPNVLPILFVLIPLQLSTVIFAESGLSFIGVGVQPPHPSWGSMLSDSRNYMMVAWWLPVLPGVALLLTVLGANLLGDGLQEVLDPKRRVQG